jgi:hypothetical protein
VTAPPFGPVEAKDFTFDVDAWELTRLQSGKSVFVKDGVVMLPSFQVTPPDLPAPLSRPR